MEDQPRSLSKSEPWPKLRKQSPEYAKWIMRELGRMAVEMREEVSSECLSFMTDDLLDTDPGKLNSAIKAARLECRFFPKVAEILAFIKRDNSKIQILKGPVGGN